MGAGIGTWRATVTTEGAEAHLEIKFGDLLEAAMTTLAHAYHPRELAIEGFSLYKQFRPVVPEGVRGAKGIFDLRQIHTWAKG